jgi:hypothetical protein
MAQVVEHLPKKCEDLVLPKKTKQKERKKKTNRKGPEKASKHTDNSRTQQS